MAQDHLIEVDAATVVTVWRRRSHAPQGLRHEPGLNRTVVISLVEGRPEIVPLQVREEVAHDERLLRGELEGGMARPVVLLHEPQRCRREQDRKSTRLNSSHGYISYAVFCLKKKKKDEPKDRMT